MKPLTSEWVQKAERDWQTAQREFAVKEGTNPDAVCYHAQQCAEKYLKALLQEYEIRIPRTHALGRLVELLLESEPRLQELQRDLRKLSEGATTFRYPGNWADLALAQRAMEICGEVRRRARASLGLEQS